MYSSSDRAAKQYKEFIADDKAKNFAMHERIDNNLYIRLFNKLPWSNGDLKDVVKNILFCHNEMAEWNGDYL